MTAAAPSDFDTCFDLVMTFDGFANDRAAGENFATTYGVTQMTWAYALSKGIVTDQFDQATKDDCKAIIHALGWNAANCGRLNPGINLMVFNDAVLSGSGHAVRLLQRVVGATEDGVCGPQTIRLANSYPTKRLIADLATADNTYLSSLDKADLYLAGWERRESYMQQHALAMVTF